MVNTTSLLKDLSSQGATGELILVDEPLEVHVYLMGGRVAWAYSSLSKGSFISHLSATCRLDRQTLKDIVEDCRRTGQPLGETLVRWGVASQEQVRNALKEQICDAFLTLKGLSRLKTLFIRKRIAYERQLTFDLGEVSDRKHGSLAGFSTIHRKSPTY